MPLQGLNQFVVFDLNNFLTGKRLVFIKVIPWNNQENSLGSKVIVQIFDDKTNYGRPDISNFGEQLTIKVRGVPPDAFSQMKALHTEVVVSNVEHVSVYGEYRNQLSIIASIAIKDSAAK